MYLGRLKKSQQLEIWGVSVSTCGVSQVVYPPYLKAIYEDQV